MTYSAEISLQAELDHGPLVVENVDELDAAIDRIVAAGQFFHAPTMHIRERPTFGIASIPDHGLKLAIHPVAGYGAIAYFGHVDGTGGAWITKSDTAPDNAPALYRDYDSATPFPADSLVPLDRWRAALREFLVHGGTRPTSVDWQPADSW